MVVFFINCYVQPRQDLNLRGFGRKVPRGRRGDRPHNISFACLCGSRRKSRQQAKQNSGAARGAEPLWKSAAADLGSSRRPWSSTAQFVGSVWMGRRLSTCFVKCKRQTRNLSSSLVRGWICSASSLYPSLDIRARVAFLPNSTAGWS